ncbi:MAG TPA: bifunctional phosphoribosylaminoimidazolecarboxamide formyltransferase/IMP cyclohydrolase [Bacteroidia bacterium]|jgi:phosphoribosylaminoimidazolecarboxamide formyltransferase/IMP cyclohydrolase|nr:bifunctional phosphoribosylaminoimidazolecarboxamide formyltransferase/IMP cyclohydrolase [Bacteroidia bacterium]
MEQEKLIQSALISVFDKDGLEPIIRQLNKCGITIYSTGGTQKFIETFGVKVIPVEDLTSYPSILGGRVKTLHPRVFGGILGRRELASDVAEFEKHEIPPIDLVVVDLYPFEKTVASGAADADIIEKIDIGGISLIRAAAKNFNHVTVIPSKQQYPMLLDILNKQKGKTTIAQRKQLANAAFGVSSHYDTQINNYFSGNSASFEKKISGAKALRYGENPHQKATFYGDLEKVFTQLHGKELSYNNLLDIDAAINLMSEFTDTTYAVIKHNNACGLASRPTALQAWKDALAGDPVSAFGGIIITNKPVDAETAKEIDKLFFEVFIAPSYDSAALEVLKQKKNRILLELHSFIFPEKNFRSLLNGVVEQERDWKTDLIADMKQVTKVAPTEQEKTDLEFANKVVKHVKSNTIVLAKNKQLLAAGTGQTSRVDALKQSIEKAQNFGFDLKGCVMASDAFFPFPDCVEIAHKVGINSVIQPGGSINDKLSIEYCDNNKMSMVTTGTRHFKH